MKEAGGAYATSDLEAPVALSPQEEQIVQKDSESEIVCVFLRHHRHELLDETFQQELASLSKSRARATASGSGDAGAGTHSWRHIRVFPMMRLLSDHDGSALAVGSRLSGHRSDAFQ